MTTTTTPQAIGALQETATGLFDYYQGHKSDLESRVATAEQQFADWRQHRDRLGQEGDGALYPGMLQGEVFNTGGNGATPGGSLDFASPENAGTNSNVYLHIRTPLNVNTHSEMFHFYLFGQLYGAGKRVNEEFQGYCYHATNSLIRVSKTGVNSPQVYVDSGSFVCLRVLLASTYHATLRLDSMQVGNGRAFQHGDFTPIFSTASIL